MGFNNKVDKCLRTVLKITPNGSLQATSDRRGSHSATNKIDRTSIINHINSFEPSISHYRRVHAPNRKYLPTDLNIRMMYNNFKIKELNIVCSYELYRKTLQSMNISFLKLGHEECFICEKYFLHEKDSQHKRDEPEPNCSVCKEYTIHKKNATESRKCYENDKNGTSGTAIYSADLQKVIMLPRYESLKEVIFMGRIIAFNESFVPVGTKQKNRKPIAVIWHEGVAGRSKSDIISTFYSFFLRHRDDKHIILWLDNCSAQNKNWALLSFFVSIVNSDEISLKKLEIKYFEPGHTFMSADSFHHQVEMSHEKFMIFLILKTVYKMQTVVKF
ncbi:uncharacterized protein LOC126744593 [Anthonomus grandis grandis]|uniref:uncharacterized protein LOC126744593 n=1 Tax=Anthonomus grandis grandis TaxID=2921223 RepID=UPI0021651E06|nr:uncharacterized protein LOC126744593 [Anthonomus grandis grandis]